MPKVTILVGIPCSGKTTFCKKFPNKDVISRDAIRLVFFDKNYIYTDANEKKVTRIFKELFASSVKEKKDIILDNTHCKEKYINECLDMVPEGWEEEIIFFDIPLWKAYFRNVIRYVWKGKWIPFDIIKAMKWNYDKINRKKYEYLVYKRLTSWSS